MGTPNPISPQTGRRRPGRPPSLTTEAITDAVLASGFESLTVSDLARRLNVNHATLYRYVRGHHQLVGLGIQRLVATTHWPAPGPDWRAYLEDTVWTLWEMFDAHPGLAAEFDVVAPGMPVVVDRMNVAGRHLVSLGFTPADAMLACDMVVDIACESHRGSEALDVRRDEEIPRRRLEQDFLPRVDPVLQAALRDVINGDPREWFAKKMAVVLDGIGMRLAPAPHRDRAADTW